MVILFVYFPGKLAAEKFDAQRTNFLSIIFAIILNSVIQTGLMKIIQNSFVVFIISIFTAALVYQFVLAIENYKKSLLVSILSQVIILVLLLILGVIGLGITKI